MANDCWQTPDYIFDWLNNEFHFDLDAACTTQNCKCEYGLFYNQGIDALEEDWFHDVKYDMNYCNIWLNPPYSNPYPWVKKAYEESLKGATVVCLLPADTSTKWFHEYVLGKAEVRFVQGRIKFVNPETSKDTDQAPKFGSIIVIYQLTREPKVIGVKRPDKPKVK